MIGPYHARGAIARQKVPLQLPSIRRSNAPAGFDAASACFDAASAGLGAAVTADGVASVAYAAKGLHTETPG